MEWILSGLVSWKTTITSILTALFIALDGLGVIHVSPEERTIVISALIVIFGWFAKDGNKTGKPTE
jgi:hypothetical protein